MDCLLDQDCTTTPEPTWLSAKRCKNCWMRQVLCLCPVAPKLSIPTRVTVLMHWRETRTTTNSARLISLCLPNSDILIRGQCDPNFQQNDLIQPGTHPLLLFPTPDAQELTPELASRLTSGGKPVHLIVPDGNWRQARKVAQREASLVSVPRVKLPPGDPSSYRLRRSPTDERISTFEAIARALGILEGAPVQVAMEVLFEIMVERTLWSRGKLPIAECKTPIPQVAIQAFYEDGCRGSARRGIPKD